MKSQGGIGEIRFRAIQVLLGLIRLSREDILMLKGGMAVCLVANRQDGLSVKSNTNIITLYYIFYA